MAKKIVLLYIKYTARQNVINKDTLKQIKGRQNMQDNEWNE